MLEPCKPDIDIMCCAMASACHSLAQIQAKQHKPSQLVPKTTCIFKLSQVAKHKKQMAEVYTKPFSLKEHTI